MRPVFMMLAGFATLLVAAPASAQWGQERTFSKQLQVEIDAGVREGRISPRESVDLREKLSRLVQLEGHFMPNGINGREYSVLMQRSTALQRDIGQALRNHGNWDNQSVVWESRSSNGHWIPDARFSGLHPGDRFSGDTRVGQHATARIVGIPAQYRGEYVDTDQVYYGYDNGRVYQIDRRSQTVLALLDLMLID